MKKSLKPVAEAAGERAFDFDLVGRLLEWRPFFVLALAIPCLLAMHWLMVSQAAARRGVMPEIVRELQGIQQEAELSATAGYQHRVYKHAQQADLDQGRRRFEAVRNQLALLIKKLKATSPGGFTWDEVADLERSYRPVNNSLLHLQQWASAPVLPPGSPMPQAPTHMRLPELLKYAQQHNNVPDADFQQKVEECKLRDWPYITRGRRSW